LSLHSLYVDFDVKSLLQYNHTDGTKTKLFKIKVIFKVIILEHLVELVHFLGRKGGRKGRRWRRWRRRGRRDVRQLTLGLQPLYPIDCVDLLLVRLP